MNGADLSRAIADMPCRCTEDDACAAHTALEELVAVQPVRVSDDDVARAFHEAYERLAPGFGYKTRDASAVPWEDVPENNRALMVATVQQVWASIARLAPAGPDEVLHTDERVTIPRVQLTGWASNVRTLAANAITGRNAQDAAEEMAGRMSWWAERPAGDRRG